ncbi:hypothetical protein ACOSQ2_021706 [Xanthoceras sorbifolium]
MVNKQNQGNCSVHPRPPPGLCVLLDDGKTERIILAQHSGFEASQEDVTESRLRVTRITLLGFPTHKNH